jgi:hypothetical protein
MAIAGNKNRALISILAGDTTILNTTGFDRLAVKALTVYNNTGGSRTITFYESPNLTSASGTIIAVYTISANSGTVIKEIERHSFGANQNIIAVGSATGVTAKITVTEYTT